MNTRFLQIYTQAKIPREHSIQAHASAGTRYTPASTSDTQVTRVHANSKSYTQVCSLLNTSVPWYLRGVNHHHHWSIYSQKLITRFASQFVISEKVTPP